MSIYTGYLQTNESPVLLYFYLNLELKDDILNKKLISICTRLAKESSR